MKNALLFLLILSIFSSVFSHNGVLIGKIIDEKSRLPLEFAFISINENLNSLSGAQGNFIFSNLEKGEYTLSISIVGYEKKEMKATVNEHQTTELIISLEPKNVELSEIVISGDKNLYIVWQICEPIIKRLDFGNASTNGGIARVNQNIAIGNDDFLVAIVRVGKTNYFRHNSLY